MDKHSGIMKDLASALVSLLLVGTPVVFAQDSTGSAVATTTISTPQAALDRAFAFTGFDRSPRVHMDLSTSATMIRVTDSTTPILWDAGDTIDVWEVSIDGFSFADSGLCEDEQYCKIWLRPETGEFIRAAIIRPDANSAEPMASGKYYERRLSSPNHTVVGFSREPPPEDLSRALLVPTLSAPCRASETIAWCIVLELWDRPARPYWCLLGRSVPFLDLHGKHTNEAGETPLVNYLSLIDAETGEAMSFERVR